MFRILILGFRICFGFRYLGFRIYLGFRYIEFRISTILVAFMQNKPNLLNAQMNVTSFYTVDYENDNTFRLPENKPNTNPISEKPKMNLNFYSTKNYKNERLCRCGQNKPKQTQPVVSLPVLILTGLTKYAKLWIIECEYFRIQSPGGR